MAQMYELLVKEKELKGQLSLTRDSLELSSITEELKKVEALIDEELNKESPKPRPLPRSPAKPEVTNTPKPKAEPKPENNVTMYELLVKEKELKNKLSSTSDAKELSYIKEELKKIESLMDESLSKVPEKPKVHAKPKAVVSTPQVRKEEAKPAKIQAKPKLEVPDFDYPVNVDSVVTDSPSKGSIVLKVLAWIVLAAVMAGVAMLIGIFWYFFVGLAAVVYITRSYKRY